MFARIALLLSLLVASSEAISSSSMKASSPAGQQLLSKSRRLEDGYDMSWMPDYSLKFQKCHTLIQVGGGDGEGGGGEEGQGMVYTQHLIEFALCPSDSCTTGTSGCSKTGATYIANFREFTELYITNKQELKETACEAVRENCNNDDEDYCYTAAGMTECIEVEGQEEDDMEKYMECEALEANNDNNNNNNYNYNYNNDNNNNGNYNQYQEYFIGPYCSSSGDAIHLGVFLDEGCSVPAESGIYEQMNYGKALPYSTTSMVEMDCISCMEVDENDNNNDDGNNNNNNNNNNDDYEEPVVNELCEQMYESAGRCETNLNVAYPDTSACDFINTILPKLEGTSRSLFNGSGSGGGAAVGFAWMFGILSMTLGVYSFLLYRRLRRSNVALNPGGTAGSMA